MADQGVQGGSGTDPGADDVARDRAELTSLLHAHRLLLAEVVEDGTLLPAERRDDVRAAWAEVSAKLDQVTAELASPTSLYQTLRLREVGLVGPEAQPKLKGWRRLLYPIQRVLGRDVVASALRWGSMVLGSVNAVGNDPLGRAGHAVQEFTTMVELLVSSGPPDPS